MRRKNGVYLLCVVCLLSMMLFGCSRTEGSTELADLSPEGFSSADLDVIYNGVTLNDKTPMEDLTSKLHLPIGETNKSIRIRATGEVNGMTFKWYQVSYPNKENEKLRFDYLYNETLESGRIVSINLIQVPTARGISVGDTLEDIQAAYGKEVVEEPQTQTISNLSFKVDHDELRFTVVKDTGEISAIYIDLDTNQAMKESDIPNLEDCAC